MTVTSNTSRIPVLFLHGIRVSGSMWRPVAAAVGQRRPVAVPDLPGHGDRRGERLTLETAVATVTASIDELGGRAVVVGHSMGGFVGMAAAERAPEKVAGLVALGCSARPHGAGGRLYATAARMAVRRPQLADRLGAIGFRRLLPPEVAEAVLAGGLVSEVMPEAVALVRRVDPIAALRDFPGPVQVVNGSRDPFRADEDALLRACHQGSLTILPRRGHIDCLAETTRLAGLVEGTAASLDATAPDRSR